MRTSNSYTLIFICMTLWCFNVSTVSIIVCFAFHYAPMITIRLCFFLISGEPIDIMKPRAVAACNDEIARDVVRLIREADQRVDMRAKQC